MYGTSLLDVPDPLINAFNYTLANKYIVIANNIVDFIRNLSAAHLRLIDPERGARLGGFYKWILYKRFESSILAYYITIRKRVIKNECIIKAIEERDISHLEWDDEDEIDVDFENDFIENIKKVIDKIRDDKYPQISEIMSDLYNDTELFRNELTKLEPHLQINGSFSDDYKMRDLHSILIKHKDKKVLLFTQYKDTLNSIRNYLNGKIPAEKMRYVSSNTPNKNLILNQYNNESTIQYLFSTDTLSEGVNIGGADIVINFDIPYNPVLIIQRIGRATRLDTPKEIMVYNFKPIKEIDKELELIDRMDMRLKNIINFIGIDYRVWMDKEDEIRGLHKERQIKDKEIYLEIIDSVRSSLYDGEFEDLETEIEYVQPTLRFLLKAINEYSLTLHDLDTYVSPSSKIYTVFNGKKGVTIYHGKKEIFNENEILARDVDSYKGNMLFETTFNSELGVFHQHKTNIMSESILTKYYSGSVDKLVYNIVDYLDTSRLYQVHEKLNTLKEICLSIRHRCGSTTESVLKQILKELRREDLSSKDIMTWIENIEKSCSVISVQQNLEDNNKKELALAFYQNEDETS